MTPRLALTRAWGIFLFCALFLPTGGRADAPAPPPAPQASSPTLSLDQVRIGMKGYGLTVFHGTTIEPFPVEVISIQRDFTPAKGVVWIRCPDERMQKTGAVMGMSGSPIYLWDDNQPHPLGQGGKLIGAFAFGFGLSKDCYVGVQPIQGMLEAAGRIPPGSKPDNQNPKPQTSSTAPGPTVRDLWSIARQQKLSLTPNWRLSAVASLPLFERWRYAGPTSAYLPNGPDGSSSRHTTALMLPLPLRSQTLADFLTPMLTGTGIQPLAMPQGTLAGKPPREFDLKNSTFKPGGVLSVPVVFGDLDLSAVGTVTDVLPDGRVLAFGHPFLADGSTDLPMATGFVHYVVPNILASFKLAGSGEIRGALLRDEGVAVAGRIGAKFQTSPMKLRVRLPGQTERTYQYQVVRHRMLTALGCAIATLESVTADARLNPESTTRLRGTLRFVGNRSLHLDSIMPAAREMNIALELYMPLLALANNPLGEIALESADLDVEVIDQVQSALIDEVRADRTHVRPGQTIDLLVRLTPYRKPAETRTVRFTVPHDLPDGSYNLNLCDASGYRQRLTNLQPGLNHVTNLDEMFETLSRIAAVRDDAIYLILEKPQQGLTLGRQELPRLPSSRRILLGNPARGVTVQHLTSVQTQTIPTDFVPLGAAVVNLTVDKNLPQLSTP